MLYRHLCAVTFCGFVSRGVALVSSVLCLVVWGCGCVSVPCALFDEVLVVFRFELVGVVLVRCSAFGGKDDLNGAVDFRSEFGGVFPYWLGAGDSG